MAQQDINTLYQELGITQKNSAKKSNREILSLIDLSPLESYSEVRIARCCEKIEGCHLVAHKPAKQDYYVIHSIDCRNIKNLSEERKKKLLDILWLKEKPEKSHEENSPKFAVTDSKNSVLRNSMSSQNNNTGSVSAVIETEKSKLPFNNDKSEYIPVLIKDTQKNPEEAPEEEAEEFQAMHSPTTPSPEDSVSAVIENEDTKHISDPEIEIAEKESAVIEMPCDFSKDNVQPDSLIKKTFKYPLPLIKISESEVEYLMGNFTTKLIIKKEYIDDDEKTGVLSDIRPLSLIRKDTGEETIITKNYFTIGKQKDNDLALRDLRQISRRHLEIVKKESIYMAIDKNSTNGSFLDGIRITPETETLIRQGQTLTLANVDFLLR